MASIEDMQITTGGCGGGVVVILDDLAFEMMLVPALLEKGGGQGCNGQHRHQGAQVDHAEVASSVNSFFSLLPEQFGGQTMQC